MKVQQVLFVLFYAFSAIAISVSEATIKVNDDVIHIGEFNTQEIKQLSIESTKDLLDFEIHLTDVTKQPHQAFITLGDGKELAATFFPKFNLNKKALKLSFPASKIPISIRNLERIIVTVVVADAGNKSNLYKYLGELVTSEEFKGIVPYKAPERIGLKPEIHHIFREDPKTVNPIVPIAFIALDAVLFLGLLGAWATQIGQDLYGLLKSTSSTQLLKNIIFLSSLVGYEVVFVRYYLGTSIFTTIFHSFLLSAPAIFFGSKAFKHLAHLRKIGRA